MKYLGKKPKVEHDPDAPMICGAINAEGYRLSLLELAEELESKCRLISSENCEGVGGCWYCKKANQAKISAGEKVK